MKTDVVVARRRTVDAGRYVEHRQDVWCDANLRSVCAALIHSDGDSIRSIELSGSYPHEAGGVMRVLRTARAIADDYHLRTWSSLADGMLTVHFARIAP